MSHEENFRQDMAVNEAFMEKRVLDLHLLIIKQASYVYQDRGIVFPVAVSSTMLFLS